MDANTLTIIPNTERRVLMKAPFQAETLIKGVPKEELCLGSGSLMGPLLGIPCACLEVSPL